MENYGPWLFLSSPTSIVINYTCLGRCSNTEKAISISLKSLTLKARVDGDNFELFARHRSLPVITPKSHLRTDNGRTEWKMSQCRPNSCQVPLHNFTVSMLELQGPKMYPALFNFL